MCTQLNPLLTLPGGADIPLNIISGKIQMLHKLDNVLNKVSAWFTPLVKKGTPFYRRRVLPLQNKLSGAFFKRLQKYLKISSRQKKKLLNDPPFRRWRLCALLAALLQTATPEICIGEWWSTGILLTVPLAFLLWKGYRIAVLLLFVGQTVLCTALLLFYPGSFLSILLCWVVTGLVYAYLFRLENARVGLERSFELRSRRPETQKDIITALLLLFLCWMGLALASVVSEKGSRLSPEELAIEKEKAYRLSLVSGTIVRHVYGYADFCRQEGYELRKYPRAFAERFAPEIARVQQELHKKGSSLQEFYLNAKRTYGRRLYDSIAGEMDGIRRQAIMEMLVLQKGIPASEIRWNEAIDASISMQEACLIFDEMYESILSRPSRSFAEVRGYSGQ